MAKNKVTLRRAIYNKNVKTFKGNYSFIQQTFHEQKRSKSTNFIPEKIEFTENFISLTSICRTTKGPSVSTMIMMMDVSIKPIAVFKKVVK